MREFFTYGSVRGAARKGSPYRDKTLKVPDDELVGESYDIFSKMFLPTPYPILPGMKVSFEYVAPSRPDVWNHKPEEFGDTSFISELDKSGFIKSLYAK